MSKELIQKLENYANAGGHVIISTRTGIKDPNGHLWEAKLQEPIWDLIGAEIRFYDHLPSQYPGEVASFGKSYQWHVWGEVVSPKPDTQVLATYEDQFYKGKAAVSQRKITNGGSVTYVGVWSDDWEMEYEIVQRVYENHVDEELFDLPPYVFIEHREGVWVAVNYTHQPFKFPIKEEMTILFGQPEIEPGQILVWKTKR